VNERVELLYDCIQSVTGMFIAPQRVCLLHLQNAFIECCRKDNLTLCACNNSIVGHVCSNTHQPAPPPHPFPSAYIPIALLQDTVMPRINCKLCEWSYIILNRGHVRSPLQMSSVNTYTLCQIVEDFLCCSLKLNFSENYLDSTNETRGRDSDFLQAGRSGDRFHVREGFSAPPDRPLVAPTFLQSLDWEFLWFSLVFQIYSDIVCLSHFRHIAR
jgi:hypothetical protein